MSDTSESVFRDYKDAIKYGQRQVAKQNMLEKVDLNQAFVREDFGSLDYYGVVKDYSTSGSNRNTSVFFKDLEDHLINLIKEAQVVVGCVAWLTSIPILKALSEKKGISFIVQKEDFLRPDSMAMTNWKAQLHQLYDSLPKKLDRRDFYDTILGCMKCEPYALIDPVRCVGNCNIDRQSAFPRSHHKFALFCKYSEDCNCKACRREKHFYSEDYGLPHCEYCDERKSQINHIKPYAVWTGSFNFTKNAVMSFENAVVLHDSEIVKAFYKEYTQIAAISEPLDWTATWMEPQWKMQTYT